MRHRFFRNAGNSLHRIYPVGSRQRLLLRRLLHPDDRSGYLPVCLAWYHIVCWRLRKLLRVHSPVWSKVWCLLRRGCISLCGVFLCSTTSPMLPVSRLYLLCPLTVEVLRLRLSLSGGHSSKGCSANSLRCCYSLPLSHPVRSWRSCWSPIGLLFPDGGRRSCGSFLCCHSCHCYCRGWCMLCTFSHGEGGSQSIAGMEGGWRCAGWTAISPVVRQLWLLRLRFGRTIRAILLNLLSCLRKAGKHCFHSVHYCWMWCLE